MSEKEIENSKQQALDKEEKENEQIREMGELTLDQNVKRHRIELLTIIGEVEAMMLHRRRVKQQNMNMFCQNLQ